MILASYYAVSVVIVYGSMVLAVWAKAPGTEEARRDIKREPEKEAIKALVWSLFWPVSIIISGIREWRG